ncbi:DHA1 family tetracycline resistance protein-like MFS transporter [Shimia isoporae]|uniref:DHA1 family tetracycline resistance protein-like MFS transporter n=1 Tax=Shimia isoporae TaxID=647720 RepID=A0A4R1NLW0_9RHOB|nr:TCR/Tet family MFS transporter [Shimia isoporae]TCL08709.1 DHA1 family tetracycline resistance protein-like MFS transporter [Shimia isoporae]
MTNRLPILVILATVTIDAMGIGLIIPVMPDLIREVMGGDLAQAAVWGGILATVFAVMQFLCGPLLGNLSDRYGRRKVLLVSLAVMSADYVIMALANSMWLLVVGRIIAGITAATYATALAYMADISKPEDKAKAFGIVGAGFGIGFVLGPAIGGILGEFGTRAPFWAAAILAGANALLGWFTLTETVTEKNRRTFEWRRANPLGSLKALGKLPAMTRLLTVFLLYQIATAVYPAIWPYFTAERFGWEPRMIGVSLAVYGIGFALVQGFLIAPSVRIFGNRRTVLIGLAIEVAALLFLGFVSIGWLVLATVPIAALGGIGLPALQGIMSRRVPDDAQGELQGVSASLTSLAHIAAPLVMTQTFAFFSKEHAILYLPGAPFLLAALLMVLSFVVFQNSRGGK